MNWLARCGLVISALLLAACVNKVPPQIMVRPMEPAQRVPTPTENGIVVLGISVRAPGGDNSPVWIGWMQFDPETGRRTGRKMAIASEGCYGTISLSLVISASASDPSDACRGVQYRAYRLDPGTYALGWSYRSSRLYQFSRFRAASVTYSERYGSIVGYQFSEDALVPKGTPTFSVRAGDVVYVGDFIFDYTNEARAKVSITPGDIAAARKYVKGMTIDEDLIGRAMAFSTANPLPPAGLSSDALQFLTPTDGSTAGTGE